MDDVAVDEGPAEPPVGGSAVVEPSSIEGADVEDDLVEDELLIEEISIDGMCGVY